MAPKTPRKHAAPAPSDAELPDPAALGKLTVAVLREWCTKLGLETTGLKKDLVDRLTEEIEKKNGEEGGEHAEEGDAEGDAGHAPTEEAAPEEEAPEEEEHPAKGRGRGRAKAEKGKAAKTPARGRKGGKAAAHAEEEDDHEEAASEAHEGDTQEEKAGDEPADRDAAAMELDDKAQAAAEEVKAEEPEPEAAAETLPAEEPQAAKDADMEAPPAVDDVEDTAAEREPDAKPEEEPKERPEEPAKEDSRNQVKEASREPSKSNDHHEDVPKPAEEQLQGKKRDREPSPAPAAKRASSPSPPPAQVKRPKLDRSATPPSNVISVPVPAPAAAAATPPATADSPTVPKAADAAHLRSLALSTLPRSTAPIVPEADGPTEALQISGFVRPLHIPSLRAKIEESGEVEEFWMDSVRSKAVVIFAAADAAESAHEAFHGTSYPPERTDGGLLSCTYLQAADAREFVAKSAAEDAARRRPGPAAVAVPERHRERPAPAPAPKEEAKGLTIRGRGFKQFTHEEPWTLPPAPKLDKSLGELFRSAASEQGGRRTEVYWLPVDEATAKDRLDGKGGWRPASVREEDVQPGVGVVERQGGQRGGRPWGGRSWR
ncbi:hypothetical protein DFJ74DRAFT_463395 [Hyaloraphidium curvatum]|nr:hypothetical protein DFJ74DRAFT_463395 [Hyaloraphidium curvatum]